MLQGVKLETQQCYLYIVPQFLQGVSRTARKRHNKAAPASFIWCRDIIAAMLIQKRTKGRVNMIAQKCHVINALPISYRGSLCLHRIVITSLPPTGVNDGSQKCRFHVTPTSFIWCQLRIAEMLSEQRTKGRANKIAQQCHKEVTLPKHFNGVIVKTQKCLDIVAPWEGPPNAHSNVAHASPFPQVTGGHHTRTAMSLIELPHLIWAI